MFIHLSSSSEKFSHFVGDKYVDLCWRFHFDIKGFSHIRLISFRLKPGNIIDSTKLVNISSNLVKTDVLNPRAYIYNASSLNKLLFNEGIFLIPDLTLFMFRSPSTESLKLWRSQVSCGIYDWYNRSGNLFWADEWVSGILLKKQGMFRLASTETLEEFVRRKRRSLRKSLKYLLAFAVNGKRFGCMLICQMNIKNKFQSLRRKIKKLL